MLTCVSMMMMMTMMPCPSLPPLSVEGVLEVDVIDVVCVLDSLFFLDVDVDSSLFFDVDLDDDIVDADGNVPHIDVKVTTLKDPCKDNVDVDVIVYDDLSCHDGEDETREFSIVDDDQVAVEACGAEVQGSL